MLLLIRRIIKVSIGLVCLLMVGCSAKQLKPDGKRVRVTTKEPNEKYCEYLGEVTGNQGNWFTGKWTSNENLEIGARNDMKNKAANLGGNLVQLIRSTQGEKGSSYRWVGTSYKSDSQYVGIVWDCKRPKRRVSKK